MDGSAISPDFFLLATGAVAAFVTGVVGSPHCVAMCGPLACAGRGGDAVTRRRAAVGWQAGRLAAYATSGAIVGALGNAVLGALRSPVARIVPWVMIAGLLLSGFEVGRHLPSLPGLRAVPALLARLGRTWPPAARAALRGAATPFLPCGLLYGALVTALGGGSAAAGGVLMTSFALGGLPGLALLQLNLHRLQARPRAALLVRRALPLLAAGIVLWRVLHAAEGSPPTCH